MTASPPRLSTAQKSALFLSWPSSLLHGVLPSSSSDRGSHNLPLPLLSCFKPQETLAARLRPAAGTPEAGQGRARHAQNAARPLGLATALGAFARAGTSRSGSARGGGGHRKLGSGCVYLHARARSVRLGGLRGI